MQAQTAYEEILLQDAVRYAKAAGSLIVAAMNGPLHIHEKLNKSDLVTTVDMGSEELLRGQILRDYPEHWILSEETDGVKGEAHRSMIQPPLGYGWIIDPIDGTTNFIHKIAHFAVSIGIVRNGLPIIGVVFNPMTGDLYTALKDAGAYWNGVRLAVGQERQLAEALLATGFQATDWKPDSFVVSQLGCLAGKARNVRIIGAASLDLCLVASGRLTGFWHDGLYPWDAAAGIVIVQEAGGTVTNGDGGAYALSDVTLVTSNGAIHAEMLKVLQSA